MNENEEILESLWEEKYRGASIVGYSDAWDSYQKVSDHYMTKEEAEAKYYHRECDLRPVKNTTRVRKKEQYE